MTATGNSHPPRSQTLRLWLIIGSVVAVLAVVPAALMGMMSVMASDSGVNGWVYAFIYTSLTFPIAIILGPILAWMAYAFRKERLAWILLLLPLAWPAVIVVLMIVGPGA